MVPVIFDSEYQEAISMADVLEMERADRWCLELHECSGLIHGLSADSRRALCLFEAPDAEAVRRTLEGLGNPVSLVAWTATPRYYRNYDRAGWPWGKESFAITFHELPDEAARVRFEKGAPEGEGKVPIIGDFLSLDRRRAIRLYETSDLEAVRRLAGPIGQRNVFAAIPHPA